MSHDSSPSDPERIVGYVWRSEPLSLRLTQSSERIAPDMPCQGGWHRKTLECDARREECDGVTVWLEDRPLLTQVLHEEVATALIDAWMLDEPVPLTMISKIVPTGERIFLKVRGAAPAGSDRAFRDLLSLSFRSDLPSLGIRLIPAWDRGGEIDHWIRRFPIRNGQIGILAYLGGETLGLDVVGDPALYERFHKRILRGYIMDAMEGMDTAEGAAGRGSAERFLEIVHDAERLPAPPVGLGEYRVLNGKILGGELEETGHLVHLSAFPAEVNGLGRTGNGAPYHGSPIARPSRRGRGRRR